MRYYISICFYCIFFTVILLTSCSSNKKIKTEQLGSIQNDNIKNDIYSNFNASDSLSIVPNQDENWILYLSKKKSTPENPTTNINFIIFDMTKEKVIYKNKFDNANIKWHNNNQLILTRYMGIIEQPTGSNIKIFIIDIESGNIEELKQQNKKSNI